MSVVSIVAATAGAGAVLFYQPVLCNCLLHDTFGAPRYEVGQLVGNAGTAVLGLGAGRGASDVDTEDRMKGASRSLRSRHDKTLSSCSKRQRVHSRQIIVEYSSSDGGGWGDDGGHVSFGGGGTGLILKGAHQSLTNPFGRALCRCGHGSSKSSLSTLRVLLAAAENYSPWFSPFR